MVLLAGNSEAVVVVFVVQGQICGMYFLSYKNEALSQMGDHGDHRYESSADKTFICMNIG